MSYQRGLIGVPPAQCNKSLWSVKQQHEVDSRSVVKAGQSGHYRSVQMLGRWHGGAPLIKVTGGHLHNIANPEIFYLIWWYKIRESHGKIAKLSQALSNLGLWIHEIAFLTEDLNIDHLQHDTECHKQSPLDLSDQYPRSILDLMNNMKPTATLHLVPPVESMNYCTIDVHTHVFGWISFHQARQNKANFFVLATIAGWQRSNLPKVNIFRVRGTVAKWFADANGHLSGKQTDRQIRKDKKLPPIMKKRSTW